MLSTHGCHRLWIARADNVVEDYLTPENPPPSVLASTGLGLRPKPWEVCMTLGTKWTYLLRPSFIGRPLCLCLCLCRCLCLLRILAGVLRILAGAGTHRMTHTNQPKQWSSRVCAILYAACEARRNWAAVLADVCVVLCVPVVNVVATGGSLLLDVGPASHNKRLATLASAAITACLYLAPQLCHQLLQLLFEIPQ